MSVHAWKLRVKGRVQGVGFRFYTERVAADYGIKGYVRNKADGSVEILAITDENNFPVFLKKIKEGPPMSRVNDVDVERLSEVPQDYHSFRVTS